MGTRSHSDFCKQDTATLRAFRLQCNLAVHHSSMLLSTRKAPPKERLPALSIENRRHPIRSWETVAITQAPYLFVGA